MKKERKFQILLVIVPHTEFIAGLSEPSLKDGPYPGLGSRHEAVSEAFKTLACACEITPSWTPTSMQRLTVGSVSGSHSAGGTFPDCSCCAYLPHMKISTTTGGTVLGRPGIVGTAGIPGKPFGSEMMVEFRQSPRAGAASAARSATTRSKERREEDAILVCPFVFQLVNAKREVESRRRLTFSVDCLRSILCGCGWGGKRRGREARS